VICEVSSRCVLHYIGISGGIVGIVRLIRARLIAINRVPARIRLGVEKRWRDLQSCRLEPNPLARWIIFSNNVEVKVELICIGFMFSRFNEIEPAKEG
jgi:hypothetical protein